MTHKNLLRYIVVIFIGYGFHEGYAQTKLDNQRDSLILADTLLSNGLLRKSIGQLNGVDSIEKAIKNSIQNYKKIVWIHRLSSSNVGATQRIENNIQSIRYKIEENLRGNYENGYYNSKFQIDSFYMYQGNLVLKSNMDYGKKAKIRSIKLASEDKKLNLPFIYRIAFKDKEENNFTSAKYIIQRMSAIPFIELSSDPEFNSINDSVVDILITLKERKLNQFYAMVGLLSNAYNTNQIQFTGDATLSLNNLFNRGVYFDLNWQKTITSSQFLFLKSSYPYFLNTQFGVSNKFSLENLDSQYLRVSYDIGIDYFLDWNHVITISYHNQSSSIDKIDRNEVLNGKLPQYLDYSIDQFGISYKRMQLDRPIFSRKGYSYEVQTLIGKKNILINQNIESIIDVNGLSMKRLYDSFSLYQTIFTYEFNLRAFFPISAKIGLKTTLDSKGIISETIRTNEMYFFGGIKKPRGFDDNILLSPLYASISNEFQYYFQEYFYYNIFADITGMKSSIDSRLIFPIGIGNGIALKSKGSIIQLSIAYGFIDSQPFSFNRSKVHIGYVGIF